MRIKMERKVFDKVQMQKPQKSAFDLSREVKLSGNMGELIPVYVEEVLPSDEFQVNTEIMIRLAPMISPVMHRVNVYLHYFYVPNRIIWNEWEDFITGGQDGLSSPTYPVSNIPQTDNKPLCDYMGLPITDGLGSENIQVSLLPFYAYQQIYNDYYRDETLHSEIDIDTISQAEALTLRNRCYEKDYFTSSLPWPQRGSAVGVPVDVTYLGQSTGSAVGATLPQGVTLASDGGIEADSGQAMKIENIDAADVDINDLRVSTALQRWLETQARGGYRYIETILSHFSKRVSDYRLDRPEYLGGGRQPIIISEVLNTTGDTGSNNLEQGSMAGHGLAVGNQNRFRREFEEHGYVIGILSVMPRTAYQQGIHRHWTRTSKEDYFWPLFAHLGEQEVKNKELYFDDDDAAYNEDTFGYQQRYAEYKYGCSRVAGEFRNTLDYWHLGRIFGSQPALNNDFVEYPSHSNAPDSRIFAVQDSSDKLWMQLYHDVQARRPMPYFADPRLT